VEAFRFVYQVTSAVTVAQTQALDNLQNRRDRKLGKADIAILTIIPLAAYVATAVYNKHTPLLTPDSPSYMYFGDDRPVGYPLLVSFIKFVFGGFAAVPYVQLALLCASYTFAAIAFQLLCGTLWLSALFEIALFANPGLLIRAGQIMSECASGICIGAFVALVLLLTRSPSAKKCFWLSITAAIAVTIRPVNIALILATALAILALEVRHRWSHVLLLGLLTFGAFASTPAVHALRRDPPIVGSPLARDLFGKTLFRQWPQNAATTQCDGPLIAKDTKAVDDYLAAAPDDLQFYLKLNYDDYLKFLVILPELVRAHHFRSFTQADPILICITRSAFLTDPMYFIKDAARQLWNLLAYNSYFSPEEHDRIVSYLASNPPPVIPVVPRTDADFQLINRALAEMHLPEDFFHFDSADPAHWPVIARPRLLLYGLRAVEFFAAVVLLWGVGELLFTLFLRPTLAPRRRVLYLAIGVCGVAFYGEVVIASMIELAQARYLYPLYPITCVALFLGVLAWRSYTPSAETDGQFVPWKRFPK